jgi:prevent-host-death family protein
MQKTISAFEARRQFGKVLDGVVAKGDEVIVERHGNPVAVVVSIEEYQQMRRQRDEARARFFAAAEAAGKSANLPPEVAEALVAEVIESVRRGLPVQVDGDA